MNTRTIVALAFGLVGLVGVVNAVPSEETDQIRSCARNACASLRDCSTQAETTMVSNQKSSGHTQVAAQDCRMQNIQTYGDCVNELQPGTVETPKGRSTKKGSTVVTAPNAKANRSTNTNTKR